MKWLRAYYAAPFMALAVLVRVFRFNRAWLAERLSSKTAAGSVKLIITGTLLAWFVIWLVAGDDLRGNLNRALQSIWQGFGE